MKKNILFLVLTIFFPVFTAQFPELKPLAQTLPYIDFDTAMQFKQHGHYIDISKTSAYIGIPYNMLMLFFRNLYEQNSFLWVQPEKNVKIPKIIHQIWIGDAVPEKFRAFQESWKKFHPDWEYRLWTLEDTYTFGFVNFDLIRKSRNPGEISDIMRYEILLRHGGVYIDFDFECLRPLDELNKMYDFYIGIQPLDCGHLQLGIGLIGSVAGHPILQAAVEQMRHGWNLPENLKNPPARTGPVFFTKIFFDNANQDGFIDIALPVSYLYPMPCQDFALKKRKWEQGGSFGIHHWANSWLLPAFRRDEFKDL